jgi:predicted nuclease of predicted toxin-antitoxin system
VPPQVLLDEQLSPRIAHGLTALGFVVTCVRDRGLIGMQDWDLIDWCAQHRHALCTKNEADFTREHRRYQAQGKTHHGILFVGEWSSDEVFAALKSFLDSSEQTSLVNTIVNLLRP